MSVTQIAAGLAVSFLGAIVWASIAYFAHVEIGWIAWGIGAAIGAAVAFAGRNGTMAGILAVVMTVVSLLVGKFLVVEMQVRDFNAGMQAMLKSDGEPDYQEMLAARIAEKKEEAGEEIAWPEMDETTDFASLTAAEMFPQDIWEDAGAMAAQLSDEEKAELDQQHADQMEEADQGLVDINNQLRKDGFINSFGVFDVIFFLLGVATAWGVASNEGADQPPPQAAQA